MTFDDTNSDSEVEVTSSSKCESIPDADKQLLKEEISDINTLEEKSENENTCSDVDHEIDDISSEDEDQV